MSKKCFKCYCIATTRILEYLLYAEFYNESLHFYEIYGPSEAKFAWKITKFQRKPYIRSIVTR